MYRSHFGFELRGEKIWKKHPENTEKPSYSSTNPDEGKHIEIPGFDGTIGAFKKHPRGVKNHRN